MTKDEKLKNLAAFSVDSLSAAKDYLRIVSVLAEAMERKRSRGEDIGPELAALARHARESEVWADRSLNAAVDFMGQPTEDVQPATDGQEAQIVEEVQCAPADGTQDRPTIH